MGRKKQEINPVPGRRLKKLLRCFHIQQKKFAEQIGYTEQHLSLIITGQRNLTMDAAQKIAKLMNVRVEWLMGLDNYMTQHDIDVLPQLNIINYRIGLRSAIELLMKSVGYQIIEHPKDIERKVQIAVTYDGCFLDPMDLEYTISKDGCEVIKLSDSEFFSFSTEIADFLEFKLDKLLKKKEK